MLIVGREHRREHGPWLAAVLVISALATAWYAVECAQAGRLVGGSSVSGFTCGVAGGLIIVFEMLLWVRKKFRVVRMGRAKVWMKAHIWLGLLCLPLLALHSGFRWNAGPLSSVLMFLLFVVVASGIWGLALQQFLPKIMLDDIPAETIYSQIGRVLTQSTDEAERIVRLTCGRDEPKAETTADAAADSAKAFVVVGAVRSAGPVQGKLLQTRAQAERVPGSEPLLEFFEREVAPFVRAKGQQTGPLASAKQAKLAFANIRARLRPAAYAAVEVLEELCEQRRQLDLQARLHIWLHSWLWVHLPLSAALFALMIAHVYYALKYY
jgi:hypothetical protein